MYIYTHVCVHTVYTCMYSFISMSSFTRGQTRFIPVQIDDKCLSVGDMFPLSEEVIRGGLE